MSDTLQARMDTRLADPEFTSKLMAGDADTVRYFNDLGARIHGVETPSGSGTPGAATDLFAPDAESKLPSMVGTTGPDHVTPSPTPRQMIGNIQWLRAEGFPERAIVEMYDENRSYTQDEHDFAKARMAEFASDREFQQRLFAGGFRERYLINCASRILSGGIKKAA